MIYVPSQFLRDSVLWLILYFSVAIAVACHDADVRNVKALIVGPPETPYEFGFFEVKPLAC